MAKDKRILVFEPRPDGHHPKWAALVSESLTGIGYQVTLATTVPERVQSHLTNEKNIDIRKIDPVNGVAELAVADSLRESLDADEVYWTSLDNFASSLLRSATIGKRPPLGLKGKIAGVYHRPRPIDPDQSGLGTSVKRHGFKKLYEENWWSRINVLDPQVAEIAESLYPNLPIQLICDPAAFPKLPAKSEARAALKVPGDKIALLHFGVYAKRKGLGLLLEALEECPAREKFFLLRAGKAPTDAPEAEKVKALANTGLALSLDYFVDSETEAKLYAAADIVTLPYLSHYGSANLLSAAAAAQRPVLASDHHLLGRQVKDNKLGWRFNDRNASDLAKVLEQIASEWDKEQDTFKTSLQQYAQRCNYEAFHKSIAQLYAS
ncbi:glycosyltransferase [Rubellicoccus peritrichatus]|uniref:Glycosyltransferase n=1 Tax=Rubellicoccus peritrichatus TaxID=3080537 RepID=A0AAQ3LCY6_9BACT|nr:glycosyltransferase [Puniceicoccus sp. CR14]WOO39679.1 glycosyltransferase [Puniceicoccus sp. CR14]